MTSEWTRRIRMEIGRMSTKTLIGRYNGMNDDGRKAAREELARRKVKAKQLPYKKRTIKRSNMGFVLPKFKF